MEADAEQFKRDVIQCLRNQEQSLLVFKSLIENKDVVIFLGNTRSGKSTLVNYQIGNKLEGWKSGKDLYKIGTTESDLGPEIGQGSLSCTALPGVYQITGSDEVFVDSPGFDDNRGVVQDIINALCINQIIYARSVKYVLVCDIVDIICDNIRNFTNALNQIQTLVYNFDELTNSFAFIFTKDSNNYTQEEIIGLLREKILNQNEMDVNTILLQNLVENKQLIGIFKMPTHEGAISPNLAVNVEDAIKQCLSVNGETSEIKFAFSDKAKEALLQLYPEYTDTNYFKGQTDKIIESYNNYFQIDQYVFASYQAELEEANRNLVQLASELERHRDANRTQLLEIQESLDELLELPSSSTFKANFKFVIMLDHFSMLEQEYKVGIETNYVRLLANLHTQIKQLLLKIEAEMSERRENNLIFATAGAVGAIGIVPALAGSAQVIDTVVETGSTIVKKICAPGVAAYSAAEAAVGGTLAVGGCIVGGVLVGAGAGSAYVLYNQTYGRRIEARREQGRPV